MGTQRRINRARKTQDPYREVHRQVRQLIDQDAADGLPDISTPTPASPTQNVTPRPRKKRRRR